MDSAINGLARHIVEGLPECWGDQVVDGQVTINLTIQADILDELIEEVQRLDMPRCRICGCTDDNACPGGCYWVEEDLCSECVETDRLQDAAKDMRDALEIVEDLFSMDSPNKPGKDTLRAMEAARTALAKVRGQNLSDTREKADTKGED